MAKRFVKSKLYNTWNGKTESEKQAYSGSVIFAEDRKFIIEGNADGDGFVEFDGRTPVNGECIEIYELAKDGTTYEGKLEINHGAPLTGSALTLTNGSKLTPAHGETFDVITGVTKDKFGHITGGTKQTVQLPGSGNITSNLVATNSATSTQTNTSASTNTTTYLNHVEGSSVNNSIQVKGAGTVTVTAVNDVITITGTDTNTDEKVTSAANHYTPSANSSSELTATTSGSNAISDGGSVITGFKLQRDAKGHVVGATATTGTIDYPTIHNNFSLLGLNDGSQTINLGPKTTSGTLTFEYSANDDITITGTQESNADLTTLNFSHDTSGVTAGSYGPSSNATPSHGKTFNVPYFTVNSNGHITAASTKTITLPADNDTKLTKVDFTAGTATTPSGNTVNVVSSIPDATGSDGKTVSSTYTMVSVPTKSYVDGLIAASDAMVFKGTIGTDGTITALPSTGNAGWTYKVITAGTYAGQTCQVGDMIIAVKDFTTASNDNWSVIQNNVDLVGAKDTIGLVKNGSDVTNISGYTASPIVNGVPYYKNTTYTSLKNPYSLKVTGGSSDVITYDGSAAKTINVVGTGTTTVTGEDGIITISSADQYKGTVTKVSTGIGLTGGDITSSGTVKAKLKSETAHTASSATPTNTASRQYAVGVDKDGYLSVNVPWVNNTYTVNDGTLTMQVAGVQKQTFNANQSTAATFNVPSATASDYGVIKVSSVNSSAVTVNSESATAGRYYPVELNSDGKAIVNVPWTDTSNWTSLNVITNSTTGTTETSSNLTNGNVYLNHVENNTKRSSHKIQGVNGTIVTYNASTDTIQVDWEWEVLS